MLRNGLVESVPPSAVGGNGMKRAKECGGQGREREGEGEGKGAEWEGRGWRRKVTAMNYNTVGRGRDHVRSLAQLRSAN